jgi:hypothetical protein
VVARGEQIRSLLGCQGMSHAIQHAEQVRHLI